MNAVEQANPQHDFYYFEQNCENYGWDDPLAAEGSYCATHGVAELAGNIGHFLGYYVPRKMSTPSQSEMRRMCSALRSGGACLNWSFLRDDDQLEHGGANHTPRHLPEAISVCSLLKHHYEGCCQQGWT